MIVLNTNVLSELWKPTPEPKALAWIDAQLVESLHLSAITVAEVRFGMAALPAGKRRTVYQDRLEREVLPAFKGRVLPFDLDTSQTYGERAGRRPGHQQGRWLHRRHRRSTWLCRGHARHQPFGGGGSDRPWKAA